MTSSVQVPCATLHDVINYLVEKTDGVLIPLIIEEQYEKNICTCNHGDICALSSHSLCLFPSFCLFFFSLTSYLNKVPFTKHMLLPKGLHDQWLGFFFVCFLQLLFALMMKMERRAFSRPHRTLSHQLFPLNQVLCLLIEKQTSPASELLTLLARPVSRCH